jgi:hypothetical protein
MTHEPLDQALTFKMADIYNSCITLAQRATADRWAFQAARAIRKAQGQRVATAFLGMKHVMSDNCATRIFSAHCKGA